MLDLTGLNTHKTQPFEVTAVFNFWITSRKPEFSWKLISARLMVIRVIVKLGRRRGGRGKRKIFSH